jgi:hypothetical protein
MATLIDTGFYLRAWDMKFFGRAERWDRKDIRSKVANAPEASNELRPSRAEIAEAQRKNAGSNLYVIAKGMTRMETFHPRLSKVFGRLATVATLSASSSRILTIDLSKATALSNRKPDVKSNTSDWKLSHRSQPGAPDRATGPQSTHDQPQVNVSHVVRCCARPMWAGTRDIEHIPARRPG